MLAPGSYPCVRNADLGKLDIAFQQCISKVDPKVLNRTVKLIAPGMVIMSDMGTEKGLGKACAYMGKGNVIIGSSIVAISHKENPIFLAYMLNSPYVRKQITMKMKGTIIQHLRSNDLRSLDIPLPDNDTQDKMADIILRISQSMMAVDELSESYQVLVNNVIRKVLN